MLCSPAGDSRFNVPANSVNALRGSSQEEPRHINPNPLLGHFSQESAKLSLNKDVR